MSAADVRRLSVAAACALALLVPAVSTAGPNLTQRAGDATVDWTRGMITARGAASGDIRAPSPSIARVGAERRAVQAARRRLDHAARSLTLAAGGTVAAAAGAAPVSTRLARAVARSRVLEVQYGSDGSAVAVVGLPVEAVRLAVAGPPPAPARVSGAPTAVIVDARGVMMRPALGVGLLAGGERYAGPVVFHSQDVAAARDPRRGARVVPRRATRLEAGHLRLGDDSAIARELTAARKSGALVIVVLEAGKRGTR